MSPAAGAPRGRGGADERLPHDTARADSRQRSAAAGSARTGGRRTDGTGATRASAAVAGPARSSRSCSAASREAPPRGQQQRGAVGAGQAQGRERDGDGGAAGHLHRAGRRQRAGAAPSTGTAVITTDASPPGAVSARVPVAAPASGHQHRTGSGPAAPAYARSWTGAVPSTARATARTGPAPEVTMTVAGPSATRVARSAETVVPAGTPARRGPRGRTAGRRSSPAPTRVVGDVTGVGDQQRAGAGAGRAPRARSPGSRGWSAGTQSAPSDRCPAGARAPRDPAALGQHVEGQAGRAGGERVEGDGRARRAGTTRPRPGRGSAGPSAVQTVTSTTAASSSGLARVSAVASPGPERAAGEPGRGPRRRALHRLEAAAVAGGAPAELVDGQTAGERPPCGDLERGVAGRRGRGPPLTVPAGTVTSAVLGVDVGAAGSSTVVSVPRPRPRRRRPRRGS